MQNLPGGRDFPKLARERVVPATPEEKRAATRYVSRNANSASDAYLLLEYLGLLENFDGS